MTITDLRKSRKAIIPARRVGQLHGLTAVMDQGIVSLANFVTVILLAKYCNDSVFTALALAGQVINYLRSAQERMISAPYGALSHAKDAQVDTLTGSSLWQNILFALITTCFAGVAALGFFASGYNQVLASGLLAQCLLLPCLLFRDHLRSVCFSRLQVPFAFGLDLFSSAAQLIGIAALIQAQRTDAISVSIVIAICNMIPVVIWFWMRPVPYRMDKSRTGPDWSKSWEYSRWLLFGRLLGVAGYLIVPWLLAFAYGDTEVALFAKAFNIIGISNVFVVGLNNYFQPLTVKAYHTRGKSALKHMLILNGSLFLVVLGGLSVLYTIAGDWLMHVVYGTTHQDQGTLITLLGLNVVAFSFAIVAGNGFAALQSSLSNFWGECSNFIVMIVATIILIPHYGMIGAAGAIVLGSLASALVTTLILAHQMKRLSEEPST